MIKRVTAATGLLLVIGGAPMVLLMVDGAPGLDGLPDLDALRRAIELRWLPTEWVMQILALLAWGLWVYVPIAVVLRVAGSVEARLHGEGRLWAASEAVTWSPVKLVVDIALGAVLLSSTVGHETVRAKSPVDQVGWGSAFSAQMAVIREDAPKRLDRNASAKTPTGRAEEKSTEHVRSGGRSPQMIGYIVRPGDSLWGIAESRLQDPYRWPEIWHLNKNRVMPDGECFSRPGFIRPGWTLDLPRLGATDGHKKKRRGARQVTASESEPKKAREPVSPPPAATARDDAADSRTGESPPSPPLALDVDEEDSSRRIELPDGTAVTAAFVAGLVSGIAAARLRRRRRRRRQPVEPSIESAREGNALKLQARLMRAGLRETRDFDPEDGVVEAERVERFVEQARADDPSGIVVGHRAGEAVIAPPSNILYSFDGNQEEVVSRFSDVATHALVSHRRGLEIWTTPGLTLPSADMVRVFDDASALLMELELEVIKRRGLLHEEEVKDWDQHRAEIPDDPLSLVVAFITRSVEEAVRDRVTTVVEHGAALGVMILSHGPGEDSIDVAGSVLGPRGRAARLLGEGPIDSVHVRESDRRQLSAVLEIEPEATDESKSELETTHRGLTPPASADGAACIQVQLLGPPRVVVAGREIDPNSGFGPKTRELLFYFVLHPEGASRDAAIEALWPDSEPEAGAKRFWATIGKVRSSLRNDQAPAAMFIRRSGEIYRVEQEYFDVDVWAFDRLLNEDLEGEGGREALARSVQMYRDDLLQGTYCEWVEPLREQCRSRFLDALVRLAEEYSNEGDDKEAGEVVLRAIAVDPFAEPLYRRAMLVQGKLGHRAEIERLYNNLVKLLADELGVEPEEETVEARNQALQGGGMHLGRVEQTEQAAGTSP
jgi:DNA-binding SARP family transcriptional activator